MSRAIAVLVLIAALLFACCSSRTRKPDVHGETAEEPARQQEVDAALDAAESWLSLMDGGEYERSWQEAAQYFKNVVTQDDWLRSIRGVRQPLGKKLSRELKSKAYRTSLPGAPDGEYVVIQFAASFENKKSAVETVTPMRDADGAWRVSGYYIR